MLPPTPDGRDLDVTIECASDASARFGAPHCVIIHTDWTVETPHDLEAERVARSFGGWSTCLTFVERVIPAYRRALQVMTNPNRLLFDGERSGTSTSRVVESDENLSEYSYPRDPLSLRDAVRREIKPNVILPARTFESGMTATMIDVERSLYKELFARAGRFWAASGDPRQIDGGAEGFRELWNQGLLPTHINELARSIPRVVWPLAPQFYSHAYFDEIDFDWLAGVVNCFPEREFAEWAVTQATTWAQMPTDMVWRMYELGMSAREATDALEQRVPIESLTKLAKRPSVGGPTAARWLTIWARLGVTPSSSHYRLLEANRALLERPPLSMLDSTANALRKFGPDAPDRTELAVMLALTSDLGLIKDAIRGGVRAATDIHFIQMVHRRRTK